MNGDNVIKAAFVSVLGLLAALGTSALFASLVPSAPEVAGGAGFIIGAVGAALWAALVWWETARDAGDDVEGGHV